MPFSGIPVHLVFPTSMTIREILRSDASNKPEETGWRLHLEPCLLQDTMAHSRATPRIINGGRIAENLMRGDESAADLGLTTERGFCIRETRALMNTHHEETGQRVGPPPTPQGRHHPSRIPRPSRGKEKQWTWAAS
jgi:hypothetical protein